MAKEKKKKKDKVDKESTEEASEALKDDKKKKKKKEKENQSLSSLSAGSDQVDPESVTEAEKQDEEQVNAENNKESTLMTSQLIVKKLEDKTCKKSKSQPMQLNQASVII